jgi:hypothetical protein
VNEDNSDTENQKTTKEQDRSAQAQSDVACGRIDACAALTSGLRLLQCFLPSNYVTTTKSVYSSSLHTPFKLSSLYIAKTVLLVFSRKINIQEIQGL